MAKDKVIEAEFDIVEPQVEVPEFEVVEANGVKKVEITNFVDPVVKPSEVGTSVELRKLVVLGNARININEMTAYVDKVIADAKAVDISAADEREIRSTQVSLNKLRKELNDARIALNKEWMSPFDSFIADPIKGLVEKIDKGKAPIAEKLQEILAAWEAGRNKEIDEIKLERLSKESEVVHEFVNSLSWFFNPKWLNKTTSIKAITVEIDEKVTRIVTDLKAIEGTFGSQLLEFYAKSGDLGQTLAERDRLVKVAEEYERVKAEQEARRLEDERIAAEKAQKLEEERQRAKAEEDARKAALEAEFGSPTVGKSDYIPPPSLAGEPQKEEAVTGESERIYTFEVRCTAAQMKLIAEFINSQKIKANLVKNEEVQ